MLLSECAVLMLLMGDVEVDWSRTVLLMDWSRECCGGGDLHWGWILGISVCWGRHPSWRRRGSPFPGARGGWRSVWPRRYTLAEFRERRHWVCRGSHSKAHTYKHTQTQLHTQTQTHTQTNTHTSLAPLCLLLLHFSSLFAPSVPCLTSDCVDLPSHLDTVLVWQTTSMNE